MSRKEKQIIAIYNDGHICIRLKPKGKALTECRHGVCIPIEEVQCPIYNLSAWSSLDFIDYLPTEAVNKKRNFGYGSWRNTLSLKKYIEKLIECGGVLIENKDEFFKQEKRRLSNGN